MEVFRAQGFGSESEFWLRVRSFSSVNLFALDRRRLAAEKTERASQQPRGLSVAVAFEIAARVYLERREDGSVRGRSMSTETGGFYSTGQVNMI